MRWALVSLSCTLLWVGCKKSEPADVSSPEGTLTSFFAAVNDHELGDQLDALILDPTERKLWKLRCKSRGCLEGSYKIVETSEQGESSTTLLVDYKIIGEGKQVVIKGTRSPIRFERMGKRWGIVQFGTRNHRIKSAEPTQEPTDAGAPSP